MYKYYQYNLVGILLHQEGFQPWGVYALPDPARCVITALGWLYALLLPPDVQYYQHLSKQSRNAEIVRRYREGESSAKLASEFGISDRRVRYWVKRAKF